MMTTCPFTLLHLCPLARHRKRYSGWHDRPAHVSVVFISKIRIATGQIHIGDQLARSCVKATHNERRVYRSPHAWVHNIAIRQYPRVRRYAHV